MTTDRPRQRLSATCVAAMLTASVLLASAPAAATDFNCGSRADFPLTGNLKVIGLTADQRLVRFRVCSPERVRDIGAIHDLQWPDTKLVGIDYRVQDGKLYGVGNGGGIYTIETETAAATLAQRLTVDLDGDFFGVDFNPAANALRIVSNKGQNLRQPFAGPLVGQTQTDKQLNYVPGTPTQGVTAAAYTNNDLDANTATTLFDVDTMLDQVVIQVPPNDGTLVLTGKLKVDAGSRAGFDIYTKLRHGAAVANSGFASLVVSDVTGFYRIDMLSGGATLIGYLGDKVIDIALPLDQ